MTDRVSDHLEHLGGLELVELGPRTLRHVSDPVELVEVREVGHAHDIAVDPVCHMQVTEHAAGAVQRRHDGRLMRFCSSAWARLLDEHPDAHA